MTPTKEIIEEFEELITILLPKKRCGVCGHFGRNDKSSIKSFVLKALTSQREEFRKMVEEEMKGDVHEMYWIACNNILKQLK